MDIYSFVFLIVFLFFFLFSSKISVQSFIFLILWFSINCLFDFFLYEKRLVSLRRSPRFSTMIALFLYESLSACFQYFTPPFFSSYLFLPILSKSLPFHLKYLLLPLSFLSFFVFSLSRIHMRAYIL